MQSLCQHGVNSCFQPASNKFMHAVWPTDTDKLTLHMSQPQGDNTTLPQSCTTALAYGTRQAVLSSNRASLSLLIQCFSPQVHRASDSAFSQLV